MVPEYVVAVDLGGTLTKVAYADDGGSISDMVRLQTPVAGGGDALVDWLAKQVTRFAGATGGACVGYGVAVPGIIEAATGTVRAATNLGWYDVALRDRLADLIGMPGAVAHDVRSAGLAEWRLGIGSGVSNLLFLALGTGIAGAMIVDGRMVESDGYAGEVGHIRVAAAGDTACACGQRGCLELVASASGVARTYARLAGLTAAEVVDAREVARRARTGDGHALGAFEVATEALTEALMICLGLLGPEVVVLGGGLAAAADLLVPQLTSALAGRVTFHRLPRIATATLGADAGVTGAGLAGWDHVRARRALRDTAIAASERSVDDDGI